jgi:hypothetical protein
MNMPQPGTTLPTWSELMHALAPIGDGAADRLLAEPNEPLARMEMFRFLHEMISQAFFALQYQDPKYPDFWPMFNLAYGYGFANPDDSYYQAVLEDSGIYRISGHLARRASSTSKWAAASSFRMARASSGRRWRITTSIVIPTSVLMVGSKSS